MKKLIFLLSMAVISITGYSQFIKTGIKGGLNISDFNGSLNNIKTESLLGFHAGLFLNIGLGNIIAIQPEALISTSGAKITDVNNTSTKDYKLTYITFPVMLKIKTIGPLYLELGPQAGFKIGDNITDETIEQEFNKLDLSAVAGLGIQIRGFSIGGRYIAGLSKVGNFEFGSSKPDFKNGIIQAGIAIRF